MSRIRFMAQLIDERNKQLEEWSLEHDKEHSINDWVALIVHQLGQIAFTDRPEEIEHNMVAIAALAMACAETQQVD